MPLLKSKSDKAVGKNIETEMDSGRPHKQSIAIALSVQRQAKKKKMAQGGVAEHNEQHMGEDSGVHCEACQGACRVPMADGGTVKPPSPPTPTIGDIIHYPKGASMADGGEVAPGASNDMEDHYDNIADAILRKRKAKMMAEGGVADNDEETPAMLSPFDDENAEAAMKENYGPQGQFHSQPEDSNEMGDDREDETGDKHDMVGSIRKKMKMRVLGQRS